MGVNVSAASKFRSLKLGPLRYRISTKSRGLLRDLLPVRFSVAVGANTHAHAGSAEADTATFLVATALDVPLTRSVITV